jgi:hypothetical protein
MLIGTSGRELFIQAAGQVIQLPAHVPSRQSEELTHRGSEIVQVAPYDEGSAFIVPGGSSRPGVIRHA